MGGRGTYRVGCGRFSDLLWTSILGGLCGRVEVLTDPNLSAPSPVGAM